MRSGTTPLRSELPLGPLLTVKKTTLVVYPMSTRSFPARLMSSDPTSGEIPLVTPLMLL
jgi:hypothetical protein